MSNGCWPAIVFCMESRSRTSTASGAACWPRERIASAASSISFDVRAANVTCAPASASAEAAARPMPRPPPVTSARLPSSRNEGVEVRSTAIFCHAPGHPRLSVVPLSKTWMAATSPAMTTSFGRLGIGHVAAAVAAHADIRLFSVTEETFEHAQSRAIFADHGAGFVGQNFLVGTRLHEFADPQTASIARRLFRRQRVVGADHLVTIGNVGPWPKEQRTEVSHAVEEYVRVACHNLHVLRCHAGCFVTHLPPVVEDDHFPRVLPGLAGRVRGGKYRQQSLDFLHRLAREFFGVGDEDSRGGRAVLCLTKQIGGADFTIDAVVGNDESFGRPGKQVDA